MKGLLIEIPAPLAGAAVAVVLMAGSVLVLRRRGDLSVRRLLILWLTSWYLACVAALTLPLQIRTGDYSNLVSWYEKVNLIPLITIDPATFVLNIVMTVPLGLLVPLLTRVSGVRRAALAGLALSAAVEVTQFASDVLVSSGRTGDVNDLPANTLGAVLGYLVHRRLTRVPAIAGFAARWSAAPQRVTTYGPNPTTTHPTPPATAARDDLQPGTHHNSAHTIGNPGA